MKYICSRTHHNKSILYVSHLPGDGGKDWGYDPNVKKAIHLTQYQKNRFLKYMSDVGAKGNALALDFDLST